MEDYKDKIKKLEKKNDKLEDKIEEFKNKCFEKEKIVL